MTYFLLGPLHGFSGYLGGRRAALIKTELHANE